MSRQLAFDLGAAPSFRREDFFVGRPNALALRSIEDWQGWRQGKLALIGPAGSGKTHLAHVWAMLASAALVPGAELTPDQVPALAAAGRVAVEDAAAVAGHPDRQRALLHLHNLLLAEGGRLLITDRTPPARWPVDLPDLASRMAATTTVRLEPPDDALLTAALVKLFADRQVTVPPGLIDWLTARMERSLESARILVDRLDAFALAEGRPVSRALAARVLNDLDPPAV